MNRRKEFSDRIKSKALQLGFDACGIARAEPLREEKNHLLSWLLSGYHGGMDYMSRNRDKRADPTLLVPGSKSIVVVLLNYYTEDKYGDPSSPQISKYALGRDYHKVIRKKLKYLLNFINDELSPVQGRAFVDTAPVLERAWAQRAGLGWIGKNSMLITKDSGSYFFIGELIIDLELAYDTPGVHDLCGHCTECIDACPTRAIVKDRVVDATRCISYWTIEYKDDGFPAESPENFNKWIFGCDICQDVCPWNNNAKPHHVGDFIPDPKVLRLTTGDWGQMTEEEFHRLFGHTALMRAGYKGIKRNLGKIIVKRD